MHTLIVGITGSGKSTIAKRMAEKAKRKGKGVLVFDPYLDEYDAHLITSDLEEFEKYVKANKNCLCIVDEAGEVLERGKRDNWLGTQTRHNGHDLVFICQVATMLSRPVRTSCSQVYAFRQGALSARTMAEEFACPELENCKNNMLFEYHWWRDFTKITKHRLTLPER